MLSEASPAPTPTTSNNDQPPTQALPTFLDHVHELRRRLFWVVAVVLVVSAVAYSYLNDVINILTAPLGDKQLYYLTPAGGLTFSFKLCTFVGFVAGVPVVMYQLYRFFEPLMGGKRRSALFYVGLSTAFAAAGVIFAYFVSLPAALHFLTNFDLNHIQAMLTVDSYLSFVITYLLGAALLFQIPLLLLIINTMTPLKPSKLMKLQKFVIVGAFIIGAVISPTPDIMNQTFLALPIIAMYQLGVLMVWLRNTSVARRAKRAAGAQPIVTPADEIPSDVMAAIAQPEPLPAPVPVVIEAVADEPQPVPTPTPIVRPAVKPQPRPVMIDVARPTAANTIQRPVLQRPPRPALAPLPAPQPGRTIDGFWRPATASGS